MIAALLALLMALSASVTALQPSQGTGAVSEATTGFHSVYSVSGRASWYCLPGRSACTRGYSSAGYYAAAGPSLRAMLGNWRGKYVRVCSSTYARCVTVRLVDWCGCPNGRVIDLYARAFQRLAPLSAGLTRVWIIRA